MAGRTTNIAGVDAVAGVDTLSGAITLAGRGPNYGLQADAGTLQINNTISPGSGVSGTCLLSFQGKGSIVVPGMIQDGTSAIISVSKTNSGSVTLTAANTYSGVTTNWSGALIVNGSIAGSAVVMGGQLAGTGSVLGNATVTGGEISPGSAASNSIGSLSISGNVTVGAGGTLALEINAASQTNDVLNVGGALNSGGILYVVNLGGTLAAGQTYNLFHCGSFSGAFSSVILPFLNSGLAWNTNLSNGIISVTNAPRPSAPTSAFAAALLAYQPAGYWPLQETNPPASTAVETNLGSLGAIANAYYVFTNASAVTMDVPGALPADSDPAVAFTSSGQPFAFVPRTSPALTLQPPFTLEAWFNPLTAVYGVILGEGGGTALNGGSTYGGFQFGWAGGSQTRFETQVYHHGINSYTIFDTPNGYPLTNWYHYVLTYDTSGNATMYVNGQSMATANLTYQADSWSPFTIANGKWSGLNATRAVNGTIDEVAVYTNLLPVTEISNHYTAGTNQNPPIAYKQAVLNDNPLLYFRMDSPPFTPPGIVPPADAINFGSAPIDGQYLPGTVPGALAGPSYAGMGSDSVACLLNGIFSCVDAGYDPSFNPTTSHPFTAMIWFRGYPADGSMQTLMGRGSNSWALNLDGTTGKIVWNSGAGTVTSSTIYNDGLWHQAVGVYNGANNYLYVDGSLQGSGTASGSIAGNANDLYLGGDPSYTQVAVNERYFAGAIAHAAFLTNALSQAQIQGLYQAAANPAPLSLTIQTLNSSQVELTWNYGTLQTAVNPAGPYVDTTNATEPYLISPTNSQVYYRLRR